MNTTCKWAGHHWYPANDGEGATRGWIWHTPPTNTYNSTFRYCTRCDAIGWLLPERQP